MQEAFLIFARELVKKPVKMDLREHIYEPIYRGLIGINREFAKEKRKERLWGNSDYFDWEEIVEVI